ncbi:MAG: hypothetical protein HUK20_04320 [Fibrobacter sp.]|nr:hypothetical protein [Fibrobacter sp.]
MTRIQELEQIISTAAQNYYNGKESISDDEYDLYVEELKFLDPKNPLAAGGLAASDDTGRKKYKHVLITGTQQKCKDMSEFKKWYDNRDVQDYMLNAKVDGAGVELLYENGTLKMAISRGDGFEGEDITLSAKKWNNIVLNIPEFSGSIRGEFLLKESIFRKKYGDKMRNARNASAGLAKRLDGEGSEDMSLIAYDVLKENENFEYETDKMEWLKKVGFETPLWKIAKTYDEVEPFRETIKNSRKTSIDYGCDGIVVKQNQIDYDDLKRRTPLTQCAIKFPLETAISTLLDIEWNIAGSIVQPVGILEPVELNETTVSRVSLGNTSIMKEKGVYIGCQCIIKKSGEIIPYLEKVISENTEQRNFEIPCCCPVCKSNLTVLENGVIECPNLSCSKKAIHKFANFFTELSIDGAGSAFVEKLSTECNFKTIYDLINASEQDFVTAAGGINGSKIMVNMKAALAKEISLSKYLSLFDMKGFAEKKLTGLEDTKLFSNFYEMPSLTLASSLETLVGEEIPGIISSDVKERLIRELNIKQDDFVRCTDFFRFAKASFKTSSDKLAGFSFCFTGKAVRPRKELEQLVLDNGGSISAVKKGLSYLVTDDTESGSSKNEKAKKLGTPIITSTDFLKMLE